LYSAIIRNAEALGRSEKGEFSVAF